MQRPLAVTNTIEQTERICDTLNSAGLRAEVIRNPNDEAVAVVLRKGFDPSKITGTPPLEDLWSSYHNFDAMTTTKDILPISGPKVYPPEFLDMLDLVVQSATGESEVLATRLRSNTLNDTHFTKRGEGLGLHADFVGASSYRDHNLLLDGLNVHATRWGTAIAKLGLLRTLDETELRAAKAFDEPTGRREKQDEAYGRLAAPFTDPIELRAGDTLIFQAQQRTEKDLAGVAHDFSTLSDTRRSDVFVPHAGNSSAVHAQRASLIKEFQLAQLGY